MPVPATGKLRPSAPPKFRRFGAERRFATVLFADIVCSSRIVAHSDPEVASDRLLAILQSLADIVHQHGGACVQMLGDGIMALFGAPHAQEHHALMACLAAQAMRDSLSGPGAVAEAVGEPVGLRIAIDTGEVVGEVLDAPWWTEYRVVGPAVHVAGKLEKTAPAGSIISTERTLRLIPGRLRTRTLADRPLPAPGGENVLEVLEVWPSRSTAASLAAQRAPLLVGRDEPLAVLAAAFAGAKRGCGGAVVIRGEAGIGKSRLVCEFLRTLPSGEALTLECSQLPVGTVSGAGPWAAILRTLLDLKGDPSEAAVRAAAARLLGAAGEPVLGSALAEMLGLDRSGDRDWAGLDPMQRWAATLDAVRRAVLAATASRPVVLVFEDYQWADSRTRAVATALAAGAHANAILLIVTCRPEEDMAPDWPQCQAIDLQPLSRHEVWQLLRAELGCDPALDGLERALTDKSGGNPFFIEESIRDLENSGAIEGARGRKRLVRSGPLSLPANVQGVLGARIDRLAAEDRRLMLIASVIGHCFDVELLAAVARVGKRELLGRLNRLCALDFLERPRVMPNVEFRFRHALIQEVAYATLLKRDRQSLHAAVLRAVERRTETSLTGRDELLAHHAFHAERWRSVYRYSHRASQSAQANSRYSESERYLEQALAAIDRLADPRLDRRRTDVLIELARSLSALGRPDDAIARLVEAEAIARRHADFARLGVIALNRGLVYWICFKLAHAAEAVTDAITIADKVGDTALRAAAVARLGGIRVEQGRFSEGYDLLADGDADHAADERLGRPSLAALAASGRRASMARALGELGRFDDAVAVGDEALLIAENAKHAFSFLYAAVTVGVALIRKGDFARSVPTLERAWELGQRTHCELLKPFCCGALGYAYLRTGRTAAGRELVEQADRYVLGAGWAQWPSASNCLAEASLLLGDAAGAAARAARTVEVARAGTALGEVAWAQFILAEALARQEPTSPQVRANYESALQHATALAMAPLAARIHQGLALHDARAGRTRRSTEHRRQAADLFVALGMEFWTAALERVDA